ncbi:MAG TPA: folate-binding protein YgfZ [Polyangiaceae bacterium]|jgi:hypothetical protein|nr:folate-binding protein YgfZ [Polyangiaceae bacterium]
MTRSGVDASSAAPNSSGVFPSDHAARRGALVVPRPDLGTLTVTGSERLSWLQGLVTCDVADLPDGAGRWGLLLTKPGKILADVTVVAAEGAVQLGILESVVPRAEEHLGRFLIMEDAEVAETSPKWSWLMLHGPLSADLAGRLSTEHGGAAATIDWTGLGGAALVVPRAAVDGVRHALTSMKDVVWATAGDWERLRVERLVPLYGVDMTEQQNPHEASLDRRAVSWTKGCYLGQEAVCMQDMRGKVKRRLAIVALDAGQAGGQGPPTPGTAVRDVAGSVVGETKSAAESALFGGAVAMALLSADAASPGHALSVGDAPAHVVEPR